MPRILTIFGTRPEAIKLAPVIKELALHPGDFESIVGVTGQHDDLLNQALDLFKITPHFNLSVMKKDQGLTDLTASILQGTERILGETRPDMLLVQGDTTTVFGAALAAFYQKIRIGHVEAGLRTQDTHQPFPEEINRRLTDHMSDALFAPTEFNRQNLIREGIPGHRIFVTGNTVIDALMEICKWDSPPGMEGLPVIPGKMVLLTVHRREHFGEPIKNVFRAILRLADLHTEIQFVYPVHPNPNVRETAHQMLSGVKNVHLIPPMDYFTFVQLMKKAFLILTDSGGIQEEAPALGKPVLILRDKTERPEIIKAGGAKLVGTDTTDIVEAFNRMIADQALYQTMSSVRNLYGDGTSAKRIVSILKEIL